MDEKTFYLAFASNLQSIIKGSEQFLKDKDDNHPAAQAILKLIEAQAILINSLK